MADRLFAVERYDRSGGAVSPVAVPAIDTGVLGSEVRLVGAVHLHADDVVLALVEGPDAETVSAVVAAAGWPADRITPATWLTAVSLPTGGVL